MADFIYIKANPEYNKDKIHIKFLKDFMEYLNFCFSAFTDINYFHAPVHDLTITIQVLRYTKKDMETEGEDNVIKIIDKINDFCTKYDWNKSEKQVKYILRSLKILGIDFNRLCMIIYKSDDIDYNNFMNFSMPNFEYPKLKTTKLLDGSTINILIDPYLQNNYGLVCDLSKNIDDMAFSFNALHMYEHLMTHCWDDIDKKNLSILNGGTYQNGLCNIYITTNNLSILPEFFYKFVDFYIKSREISFWKENEKILIRERNRTISETLADKSFTSFARTDPIAYYKNYDTNIFTTWSRDPFNVLLISDTDLKLDISNFNNRLDIKKLPELKEIEVNKYNFIPLETLWRRDLGWFYVKRMKPEEIIQEFYKNKFSDLLYGIDNCIISLLGSEGSQFKTALYPLLYLRNYTNEKELEEFLHKTILGINSESIISAGCYMPIDGFLFNNNKKECLKSSKGLLNGLKISARIKPLKELKILKDTLENQDKSAIAGFGMLRQMENPTILDQNI